MSLVPVGTTENSPPFLTVGYVFEKVQRRVAVRRFLATNKRPSGIPLCIGIPRGFSIPANGGCEIRTHGKVKPYAGFQNLCLKPLSQPSKISLNRPHHRPSPTEMGIYWSRAILAESLLPQNPQSWQGMVRVWTFPIVGWVSRPVRSDHQQTCRYGFGRFRP